MSSRDPGTGSIRGQLVVSLGMTGLLQGTQEFVLWLRAVLKPVASLGEETTGNKEYEPPDLQAGLRWCPGQDGSTPAASVLLTNNQQSRAQPV